MGTAKPPKPARISFIHTPALTRRARRGKAAHAKQYHDGGFHGSSYTYADYLWPETLVFLTQLSAVYLGQLRQIN
jgi:hypothetical protein